MAANMRFRPGVHNLTDAQVAQFKDCYGQMMAIRDNRGYQFLAGLHGAPSWYCWHHQQSNRTALRLQLFLPWHRAYLYTFEMSMRDRVAGAVLPWWDWTLRPPRQDGIPVIFAGADTPLSGFDIDLASTNPPVSHRTTRSPSATVELPTRDDVNDVLVRVDWDDFNLAIEDLHDNVHGWVSGDMGIVATAAFDPIFWSHHAMIDRLWWLWQMRNGNGNIPPDLLGVVLAPFNLKVSDVLNVNDLGYDYAAGQSVSVGGTN